jgi:hypothetical protein
MGIGATLKVMPGEVNIMGRESIPCGLKGKDISHHEH